MLNSMVGGGVKKMCKSFGKDEQLYLIATGILIILIKTIVVQWTYNQIWHKTWCCNRDPSKFEPLTFYEAFLLVIMIEFLF
tara:strand:+ start:384 stop:626 length:243 start_codon:yes stop_codon:yes gene_type:complete